METSTAPGGKGEVSGDAETWTFSLRKGIQFHHGNEMKSADVAASSSDGLG
jgi:MarR-like DNA-binding transcriptional regulator SgrR of sgrS sRNA